MTISRDSNEDALDRRNAKRREKYALNHPRKKCICVHQLGDTESSIYSDNAFSDTQPDDRRNQRNARRRELYAIQGKRTDAVSSKQAEILNFNNPDMDLPQDGNQILGADICVPKEANTDIGDIRNAKRREKYATDKLLRNDSNTGNHHQTVVGLSYDVIQERRREKYASRRDANSLVNARRREKYAARNNAIVIYQH